MIMANDGKGNKLTVKRHKVKYCGYCRRRVYGRRKYCNNAHKQAAYRERLLTSQSGLSASVSPFNYVENDFSSNLFHGVAG